MIQLRNVKDGNKLILKTHQSFAGVFLDDSVSVIQAYESHKKLILRTLGNLLNMKKARQRGEYHHILETRLAHQTLIAVSKELL